MNSSSALTWIKMSPKKRFRLYRRKKVISPFTTSDVDFDCANFAFSLSSVLQSTSASHLGMESTRTHSTVPNPNSLIDVNSVHAIDGSSSRMNANVDRQFYSSRDTTEGNEWVEVEIKMKEGRKTSTHKPPAPAAAPTCTRTHSPNRMREVKNRIIKCASFYLLNVNISNFHVYINFLISFSSDCDCRRPPTLLPLLLFPQLFIVEYLLWSDVTRHQRREFHLYKSRASIAIPSSFSERNQRRDKVCERKGENGMKIRNKYERKSTENVQRVRSIRSCAVYFYCAFSG